MTARWRKEPKETGLAGVCQGVKGLELRENKKMLIHVRPKIGKHRYDVIGWYWYGLGVNTSDKPCSTIEEAKQQATEYYKSSLCKKQ